MEKYCPCGRRIPNKGDLCKECLEIYGADADEWPLWLEFQVADIRRENDAYRNSHEETFSDLNYSDDDDDLPDDEPADAEYLCGEKIA